jgi:hypothetical protein
MIGFLSGQLLRFEAKQRDIRRREPLGKSVPDRNRIGDAMNHFFYFNRSGHIRISMGT